MPPKSIQRTALRAVADAKAWVLVLSVETFFIQIREKDLIMTQRVGILIYIVALTVFPSYTRARQSEQTKPAATQTPRRSMREIALMPVVYHIPGMDEVIVKSDLKYTPENDPRLLMDIYIPPHLRKDERRPAVLFIHGNVPPGSPAKNIGIYKSWGRLVAASGMVGVAFTHRLGYPNPLLTEAARDFSSAINYIRANADSLNIDKDRICLAAYSGGGPMLSIAMREKPEYVRCMAAFYALLDIQRSDLFTVHEKPETVKTFSPITYLASDAGKIAPMFIARAGLDETPMMNDSIDRFIQEAISKNAAIIVANHPQGVHGFDTQTDDDRSREIIQSALNFMKIHLVVRDVK